MERKNMVLLTVIAVATLLVAVVGATFAYFTAQVTESRTDKDGKGSTELNTAVLTNSTIVANVDNQAGSFKTSDIYPGHMEVAAMKVSITTNGGESAKKFTVPFIYNVTKNTIGKNVKYYLYRTENQPTSADLGCTIETSDDAEEGKVKYSETCTFENAESTIAENNTTTLGGQTLTLIATDTLTGPVLDANANGKETIQIVDEISTAESQKDMYYYFVVEFVDTKGPKDQNEDMGKELQGSITVAGARAAVTP